MADSQQIVERITSLVEPIVRDELLELLEIEFNPSGGRWLLRIYLDKEDGVTIGDCERVSREVERTLDVEDIIDRPYTLEVSSPGLTRALKKKSDFERYKGRRCKIIISSPMDPTDLRTEFHGEIVEVAEEGVEIRTETRTRIGKKKKNETKTETKKDIHWIPFRAIKKAQLEVEL